MNSVTSLSFGFYLVGTVLIYWIFPAQWRKFFLLFASLLYLGTVSWSLLLLIMLLCLFTYWIGKLIYFRERRQLLLIVGTVVITGILAYFKYTPLLAESIKYAAKLFNHQLSMKIPDIIAPLGISFFTFKAIHYLIICYRRETRLKSLAEFIHYMTFFPIFTAGPIERWPHFESQKPVFRSEHIYYGVARIIIGLFKKKVLADNLVIFAGMLNVPGVSRWGYWLAAYAYAFQIYFDFSGYSDIAIGSARLFGYDIMENFKWPYLQRNLSLFWKNWHMTLTSWFTQYIFIPLGGSRASFARVAVNTLIVMAVTGLWHGASWHFMVWGIYHGLGLIAWRVYGLTIGRLMGEALHHSRVVRVISTIVTFQFVVVGWVFFATGLSQSLHVVTRMLFIR